MMAMAMQLSYRHVRDGNIGVGLALLALLTGVPLGAACAADEQCLVVSAENIVTGSGNWFLYVDISDKSCTIEKGDHLEYDIFLPAVNPLLRGGIDADLRQGSTVHPALRDSGLKDQNGLRLHGDEDLARARDQWYHRDFDLTPVAGCTATPWSVVFEGDAPGRYIQFLANIRVTRGGKTVLSVYEGGPAPEVKVRLCDGYSRDVWVTTAPRTKTLNDEKVADFLIRAKQESDLRAARDEFHTQLDVLRQLAALDAGGGATSQPASDIEAAAGEEDKAAYEAKDSAKYTASLRRARERLGPLGAFSRGFTGHLVGHAHIDFQWLWSWDETVNQIIPQTFGQAIKFMQEFPEFTFAQSSAALYLATEQSHPELFKQMQEYAKQGRWEPVGGRWCEGDLNMIAPESHVRHFLYGQRYFQQKFGRMCADGWEPDTFGHPWTMPQILRKAGIRSYYFCRAGKGKPLFWWEGPDGSKVLAFDEDAMKSWYIGSVTNDKVRTLAKFAEVTGLHDYLMVYGVGNHGGGPTRENILAAIAMQSRSPWPVIKFSTLRGFWDAAFAQVDAAKGEAVAGVRPGRDSLGDASEASSAQPSAGPFLPGRLNIPAIRGELNSVFEGCYTSHSLIKKYNRDSEVLLTSAEVWATLASLRETAASAASQAGVARSGVYSYPRDAFTGLWHDLLWNHHHDTICGSCVHASAEYSHKMFADLLKRGGDVLQRSQHVLAGQTQAGDGPQIVVFNPLAWERSDVVEAEVPVRESAIIYDADGDVPTQHLEARATGGDPTARICFLARNVPACGFKTFGLRPAPIPGVGGIAREIGTQTPECQAQLQILHEKPHGMSAWDVGTIDKTTELEKPDTWTMTEYGPVRQRVVSVYKYDQSTITQERITYAHSPRVEYETTVEWGQIGNAKDGSDMLKVAFKTDVDADTATYDIPFGDVVRKNDGHENVALKWCDLSGTDRGISVLNDCKHGYDVKDSVMRLTLLRSSYEPDPKPDVGTHHMRYAVLPHAGLLDKGAAVRAAWEFNYPMQVLVLDGHGDGAERAPRAKVENTTSIWSGCQAEPANIIVTALKLAEEGDDVILRAYECAGKAAVETFTLGFDVRGAVETDLLEREMPDAGKVAIAGRKLTAEFKPYEIRTLRLRVAERGGDEMKK